MKRIVLTGGGTAGHVTPNLALIPRLIADGWDVHYIGEEDGVERKLVANADGVSYHCVACGKLRRYFDIRNFTDPVRVLQGVGQAARLMRRLKPDIVFSKGGFVSVPVVYGARIHKIPIVIHESDMTPGLANRLSAPFAKKILCTFPEAAKMLGDKGLHTGTPIRPEILSGNRERGLRAFGMTDGRPVLMVTGGSSGAQAINRALRDALSKLLESFQVLHLCGPGNADSAFEGTAGYVQREYLDHEMADAYACANIVVSRAGSNTLCELLALRKPTLLVPYPKGASRGDQIVNARSFEARGLSHVLMQEDMTAESLTAAIINLYKERGTLFENMDREPTGNGVDNVLREIYAAAK
jgi:UDP-N-acetylglucosamine--N-acetylmuramyl-(pentapeptide) pyrophosphoryl-undecaprenol N-acetylglucosamine transferase